MQVMVQLESYGNVLLKAPIHGKFSLVIKLGGNKTHLTVVRLMYYIFNKTGIIFILIIFSLPKLQLQINETIYFV